MDAVAAASLAECLEYELEALPGDGAVECFAIPLTAHPDGGPGWGFLVVTSLPESRVREALPGRVSQVGRRAGHRAYLARPEGREQGSL